MAPDSILTSSEFALYMYIYIYVYIMFVCVCVCVCVCLVICCKCNKTITQIDNPFFHTFYSLLLLCATSAAAQSMYFGGGGDPIHYSNVHCNGREQRITICDTSSDTECRHWDDVGVTCQELCNHGEVRLSHGVDDSPSRVEVCLHGTWATVCHSEWQSVDAKVVCKQLGLPHGGAEERVFYLRHDEDQLVVTNVNCIGNESRLIDCQYMNVSSTCEDEHVAGVICQQPCSYGDARLSGGTGNFEGRVELCLEQGWGTVCDNGWSTADGKVMCRQLGYSTTSEC